MIRCREHLYIWHKIHQCPRCVEVFPTKDERDAHLHQTIACVSRYPDANYDWGQGFNDDQEMALLRYSGSQEATMAEERRAINRILFPNVEDEQIPSPGKISTQFVTDGFLLI